MEIRDKENFRNEVFRILDQLNTDAARHVMAQSRQHEAIHKLRVSIKKIRGILRLLRHEIGYESYHELNVSYRNIGRQVAALRDFTSQMQLLGKIKNKTDDKALQSTLNKTIRSISQKRKEAYRLFVAQNQPAQTQQMIFEAHEKTKQLQFSGKPEAFILHGLKTVYKKAGSAQQSDQLWQNVELFHNWRKHVKYLMYQIMLLKLSWPAYCEAYINELKKLEKTLGRLHDLHLFNAILKNEALLKISESEKSKLQHLIASRQLVLQQKAEYIGKRVFFENSTQFSNNIHELWQLP